MAKIVELGCVACRIMMLPVGPATVHHLNDGMKRAGHSATVALCPFHHFGHLPAGCPDSAAAAVVYGPSLAHGSKLFHAFFGSDPALLAYQEQVLSENR